MQLDRPHRRLPTPAQVIYVQMPVSGPGDHHLPIGATLLPQIHRRESRSQARQTRLVRLLLQRLPVEGPDGIVGSDSNDRLQGLAAAKLIDVEI